MKTDQTLPRDPPSAAPSFSPICRESEEIFRVSFEFPATGLRGPDAFYRQLARKYYAYLTARAASGAPPGGSARILTRQQSRTEYYISFTQDVICYEGSAIVCYRRIAQTWSLPDGKWLLPRDFGIRHAGRRHFFVTDAGIVFFENHFDPAAAASLRRSQYAAGIVCADPIPIPAGFPLREGKIIGKRKNKEEKGNVT